MVERSIYARFGWPILIGLGLLLPFWVWGDIGTFRHANNAVYQWLPQNFSETRQYEDFRRRFGSDEFAVISWDGCTLDDERLEAFARRCERCEWISGVTTGPRLLKTLMDEPVNLSRDEALSRLEGTLVGPDRRTTCAVATMSPSGDTHRMAVLEMLRRTADDCGVEPGALRLAGDAVTNAAIDVESRRAISEWIGLSWAVSLAVAWVCLRSARLIVMVFAVSVYSAMLATAMIHYTGGTMNLMLVVVPVLIYVLPLSAAVHLANYYRDSVAESGPAGAPLRAVAAGWMPCLLSAVTTALGLISLVVSRILPVRMFGIYSAVGILASLLVLFGVLPVTLEFWPPPARRRPRGLSRFSRSENGTVPLGAAQTLTVRLADWLVSHCRAVVGVCLGAMALIGAGIALIETTITPTRFFPPESRWAQDANWFEERLGSTLPIEVLVGFGRDCPLSCLERMELVEAVEQTLRGFEEIGGTISAATFAPASVIDRGASAADGPLGETGRAMLGVRDVVRRRIQDERLRRSLKHFVDAEYVSVGPEEELWRITARVPAFGKLDHGRFLHEQVEPKIEALLAARASAGDGVRAIYTGVVPLVFVAQRELLEGLYESFCLAFAMIAVVMTFLLRDPRAAALTMLPNVLPALVVFGVMGWTGMPVDVGAMMTASVALGIAVDDTLHFLTWFRRSVARGQTRHQAIVDAYQRCGPAMVQTTLIAGFGQVVFALSSFHPVSQFGLLMFILLTAALFGDLVLLPAMLATRLGRCFEPRLRRGVSQSGEGGPSG